MKREFAIKNPVWSLTSHWKLLSEVVRLTEELLQCNSKELKEIKCKSQLKILLSAHLMAEGTQSYVTIRKFTVSKILYLRRLLYHKHEFINPRTLAQTSRFKFAMLSLNPNANFINKETYVCVLR